MNLDCRLDLKTIALHARNAEYNPKAYLTVLMSEICSCDYENQRPKDYCAYLCIWYIDNAYVRQDGCHWCKVRGPVQACIKEICSDYSETRYVVGLLIITSGFHAKFSDFKIQNIVGSCDVKFPIRLEGLAYAHGHFSSVYYVTLMSV